jgi:hypothetical protein
LIGRSRIWEPFGIQLAVPAIGQKEVAPIDGQPRVDGWIPFRESFFWEASDWPLRNKPLLHWKRLSSFNIGEGDEIAVCKNRMDGLQASM